MKKLILCGYMGSGKTTIGSILAKNVDLPFYDLDQLIEQQTNQSVLEIFKERGEIFFRKREHSIFSEMMRSNESFVLSLGGGTPAYANNHLLLNGSQVTSVYLKASINTLYDRLVIENEKRPLLAEKSAEEMKEIIAKHLFERNFYYLQSGFTISVDGKDTTTIVSEILQKLT